MLTCDALLVFKKTKIASIFLWVTTRTFPEHLTSNLFKDSVSRMVGLMVCQAPHETRSKKMNERVPALGGLAALTAFREGLSFLPTTHLDHCHLELFVPSPSADCGHWVGGSGRGWGFPARLPPQETVPADMLSSDQGSPLDSPGVLVLGSGLGLGLRLGFCWSLISGLYRGWLVSFILFCLF